MANTVLNFWNRVNKTEGCWLWSSFRDPNGYGRTYWKGRYQYTHRIAYELSVGPIPEGLDIDHLCRVPACCNPAHLEPVTHAENMARGAHAMKTHCKSGHEFTEANTRRKRKTRICRACVNADGLRRRIAKGATKRIKMLSEDEVRFIRENYQRGTDQTNRGNVSWLAEHLGVSRSTIYVYSSGRGR